jgi:hypothetical protein
MVFLLLGHQRREKFHMNFQFLDLEAIERSLIMPDFEHDGGMDGQGRVRQWGECCCQLFAST